jgi:hypothetical protein
VDRDAPGIEQVAFVERRGGGRVSGLLGFGLLRASFGGKQGGCYR